MDLHKLRGFYWTAQLGSVSAAAQMIHVSQSAISHQLKSLESELGVKLYRRSGRGIRLTAEGDRLVGYARQVVHSVEDLESEFAELRGQPRGSVRIAAFRGIAAHQLPEIVPRFRARHPNVRLVITSRVFDTTVLELLAAGEADIGITTSWNEFGNLVYLEFISFDMFVCTPPDHPWARREKPLTLAELASEPLLLYEPGTAIRSRLDRVFADHKLRPEVPISIGGFGALFEYVKIGLGVGIVSGLAVGTHADPGVHVIPVTHLFGDLGYGYVLDPDRYLSAAARAFLELAGIPARHLPTR